jgi:predicted CoA-binding protein
MSRMVMDALAERGYDVVPVNPNGGEIAGKACARSVGEIAPGVDGALLMTPPAATAAVVRECAQAGIRRVWLHRGAGQGAVSDEALAAGRELGLEMVEGACPMMFLPGTGLVHRIHGFFQRRRLEA